MHAVGLGDRSTTGNDCNERQIESVGRDRDRHDISIYSNSVNGASNSK